MILRKTDAKRLTVNGLRLRKKHCKPKKVGGGRFRSAFRAIASEDQFVPNGGVRRQQVLYGREQFDLGNEYNPATSTFRPRNSGVYSLIASLLFMPVVPPPSPAPDATPAAPVPLNPTIIAIAIFVNGRPRVFSEEHLATDSGSVNVSAILRLGAGDRVQVFLIIRVGSGFIPKGIGTHFEGARIG